MTPDRFLEFARVFPEPLVFLSGEGKILSTNRPAAALLGKRSQELRGTMLFDLVTESPDKINRYLKACSTNRKMVLGSLTFRSKDETPLVCRCEGAVIQPRTPEVPALVLFRLEHRDAASNQFVLLNQKIDQLAKEVQQRQQAQEQLLQANTALTQTLQKLQQTQSKLVHQEKMSSLGQMVAGIAHEINNPVSFIHGNLIHAEEYLQDLLELLSLYQSQFPQATPEIQERSAEIDVEFLVEDLPNLLCSMRVGTTRIREIVLSLRTFSRLDEAAKKEVNLHDCIDSTLMILGNRLKAKTERQEIMVVKNYGKLPRVECYAGQLNQVFMNILANAIDALEESSIADRLQFKHDEIPSKIPTITISTAVVDDRWIQIKISDNGLGIPTEVQTKLFDPFFTTKPVGKGTGLGLSISHQIITEKHQGNLKLLSSIDRGTEFIIELPLSVVRVLQDGEAIATPT